MILEPSLTAALDVASSAGETWQVNPYLHIGADRVYNPLTDALMVEGEPGYTELRALLAGWVPAHQVAPALREDLLAAGWLTPRERDLSTEFRLKYVSIESSTHCNQSCYFCPVSIAPRETHKMPTELYQRIMRELSVYSSTIEGVFMINYNEPTADPRFVDLVSLIKENGLPPAVLTNGTGLTPQRVDRLVEMGGLRFLSINLSTLDAEKYHKDRGHNHLPLVLRHVDYAAERESPPRWTSSCSAPATMPTRPTSSGFGSATRAAAST